MATVKSYLAISGRNLNPDELTKQIGLRPSTTSVTHPDRSGYAYWQIDVARKSLAIEDHVSELLEMLGQSHFETVSSQLLADGKAELNFFVSLSDLSDGSLPHLMLPPTASAALARLGICLVIDMN